MGKGDREREKFRQEREEAEAKESRGDNKRMLLAYAAGAIVVLAIVVGIIVLASGSGGGGGGEDGGNAHINGNAEFGSTNGVKPDEREGIPPQPIEQTNLNKAAREAGCYLQLHLEDEGHEHIPQNSPTPQYKTDPPTSGDHAEPPYQQADGAYLEMPHPIDFVHSLEHGRMEIQYAPDLSEKIQRELKGLYDTMYGATLLFPNTEMNYAVAATTWTNLIGCTSWQGQKTIDAIRDFGKATWGKYGGEPVFAFKFTGPTPAEPEEPSAEKSE